MTLHRAAAALVERELAAVHAATGFSSARAAEVAALNARLLSALGFGHGTLAEDLQEEDEDEDDEDLLASPAAREGKQQRGPAVGRGAVGQTVGLLSRAELCAPTPTRRRSAARHVPL